MSQYEPSVWKDDAVGNTPITAAKLTKIEAGIAAAVRQERPAALDASGATTGGYDPIRMLFNRKTTNTFRATAGLAKAAAGLQQVIIVLAGDSTTSQYNSGSMSRDFLASALAGAGVSVAGEIVMANKGGVNVHTDERISLTGAWVTLGQSPYLESDASGNRITFTSTRPGTSAQLKYMANGAARWRVDGGAWMDLAAVGTNPTFAQVDNLPDAVHTVDFESTTGNPTWIGHIGVFRNTGVIVVNTAAEGVSCSDWQARSPWNHGPVSSQLNPIAVFMNLGINDQHGNVTPASFKANLEDVLSQFTPATDIFIETSNPTEYSDYADYDAAKFQLAVARDCTVVDVARRFISYSAASNAGFFAANDNTHMNLSGYFVKGQARLAALLPR
ncbi:SGNH/GDSL hydrolase family protein [Frondihabitans sp. VKM Ac-2883]|uniref:SGNH/GDSL hydrolase family protein n=1 Tax=Frondihabitans sp. VKM Ac-2883 TaxID=2783823 RepID=UPI00188DBE74|nr:SGNH/GDSL hydrolase family protein [Frondihabitans sp. VKM Ac-2883]MBF4574671.1 SGNH/GDSL hydrolase family protein [Frondihabitans sp. VKM Ac-2883]